MRYRLRRDLNDAEITEAIKAAGFNVIDLTMLGKGIPDKLIIKPLPQMNDAGQVFFVCWVEIKSKRGKLQGDQHIFRAIFEPRGEWLEARDPQETVNALMERYTDQIKPEAMR
jgi:hypothetical protein